MTPEKVSQAVIKQVVSQNSGQVIIPSTHGVASLLRGFPNWIQERLRDRSSGAFLRLRQLEQELGSVGGKRGAMT